MITLAMRFFFKKKRFSIFLACMIGCMVMCSYSSFAQGKQSLPDSVNVEDTVSFEKKPEEQTAIEYVDTANQEKPVAEDSVVFRAVPDSVIADYKKDRDFAYANNQKYWIQRQVRHEKNFWDWLYDNTRARWIRSLLLVLLISVVIFGLYKIVADNKLYMFYSPPKKKAEEIAEESDMSYPMLEKKINGAIESGDFRSALRYMHLKALKKAADKDLIRFHAHGTNHEYMAQLNNHPVEKDFRYLTNVYEYVWYGGFALSDTQFGSIQTQFSNLYNTIDH